MRAAPRNILGALICAAIATGASAPALGVPDATGALERHRATDRALQATSAELAMLRTRTRALSGAALRANRSAQARLERRKLRLLRREKHTRADAGLALERRRAALRSARAQARRAREDATRAIVTPPAPIGPVTLTGDDGTLADAIDGYLASKASPLVGQGAVFVGASRAVGLDPRLLVAIAGAETSFATYGPSQAIHNPFGMGPGFVYRSWAASIEGAARNLAGSLYLGDGRVTIDAIHARWAPIGAANDPGGLNGHWPRNVAHYYAEQGGDPGAPVFGTLVPAAEVAPGPVPPTGTAGEGSDTEAAGTEAVGAGRRDQDERGEQPGGALMGRFLRGSVVHGPMIDRAQGW